ncbi:MAG: hypothetical protein BAJALOKI2v1_140028 [Promethearchaeota archaeon]|nr:MAG: hypothetical protein BAJALOKI2v1_140028 [Candidatus Lokiarchaeota archaeon]
MFTIGFEPDKYFGEIKFAEQNSLPSFDFEHSLNKYFSGIKLPHGKYKFGEIENSKIKDFESSFQNYFH